MKWTTDLPTQPGWYRVRTRKAGDTECQCVKLTRDYGGRMWLAAAHFDWEMAPEDFARDWDAVEWGGKVDFGEVPQ